MAALEKALPRLRANDPSLACLDLEENNIGDGGAAHVADALRVNTSLKNYPCLFSSIIPSVFIVSIVTLVSGVSFSLLCLVLVLFFSWLELLQRDQKIAPLHTRNRWP
eukprot:TRINITY_DN2893_c0_g1_i1.p2 TRINITY_DN2893_c0_g1~~TRINITY_DN2893_c0_g1_i1.p2  ORF type:complete len:124 (-),score=8.81 TRINITY_DN2893_c0_g1_i1:363-686(-)